jgi:hypothetical protein
MPVLSTTKWSCKDFKKIASNGITYLDFRKSMNEKNGKLLSACHFQKYMVYWFWIIYDLLVGYSS